MVTYRNSKEKGGANFLQGTTQRSLECIGLGKPDLISSGHWSMHVQNLLFFFTQEHRVRVSGTSTPGMANDTARHQSLLVLRTYLCRNVGQWQIGNYRVCFIERAPFGKAKRILNGPRNVVIGNHDRLGRTCPDHILYKMFLVRVGATANCAQKNP